MDIQFNVYDLIAELKQVVGARAYDGEASVQVLLPTMDGRMLRVGVIDDDEIPNRIWFDYYPGLNNEIKENLTDNKYLT